MLCHLPQSHLHNFSVLADERHKIGDRAECRDVQILCKGLLSLHLPKCLNELKRDTNTCEILLRIGAVCTMRVHHGIGRREHLPRQMMIRDDDVHAPRRLCHSIHRGNAAVHRHKKATALPRDLLQGIGVQPIALRETVRDIVGDIAAKSADAPHQEGGCRHAVHVVVPVDHDRLVTADGTQDALCPALHIRHEKGIMKRRIRGMEKSSRFLCRADTALPEELSDDGRDADLCGERVPLVCMLCDDPFFQHVFLLLFPPHQKSLLSDPSRLFPYEITPPLQVLPRGGDAPSDCAAQSRAGSQ